MEDNRLPKRERLAGRKRIERLFAEGTPGFTYPFRYICHVSSAPEGECGVSMLVSVSKKYHKRAVRRNKIKRRTRESFRLSKHEVVQKAVYSGKQVDLALLYITKETEEFKTISDAVGKILEQVAQNL